jgi:hypothetical protein
MAHLAFGRVGPALLLRVVLPDVLAEVGPSLALNLVGVGQGISDGAAVVAGVTELAERLAQNAWHGSRVLKNRTGTTSPYNLPPLSTPVDNWLRQQSLGGRWLARVAPLWDAMRGAATNPPLPDIAGGVQLAEEAALDGASSA